uniref:hypothetical protein n=1 Tax=Streptosporangium sp. CA-235898 TaxID=3240073 RepID=UPI003F4917EE
MKRIWGKQQPAEHTPAKAVCHNGQRADVLSENDGWMQLQLPDGTTPNVLASRTQPCTCGGKGCPR